MRALSSPNYKYYKLTQDFGVLKAGAIFYHDPDDHIYGSQMQGCLKLCWTPDGNCYDMLCGDAVILHTDFALTDMFEEVEVSAETLLSNLHPGTYKVQINDGGYIFVNKYSQEEH